MSSTNSKTVIIEGDSQLVPVPKRTQSFSSSLPPLPIAKNPTPSTALVEYTSKPVKEEEDLEIKLRRIIDNVPVRVNNTSGSSAGSGSGDFHQYRQMRRKEQDRLARMDAHYEKVKEVEEFNLRRDERLRDAEDRTARKRLKRQKKKMKKKGKRCKVSSGGGEEKSKDESEDGGGSDGDGHSDDGVWRK
ncbi:hypothetical protein IFM89_038793 [Coptis chinensis]|uniref:PRKR-interacting protein 1 n=1 Tax=Coptis chinensis TaxID=261450 RepID=A0A835J405_9MAGN|nr:hypothetical protein IFM89_038793 [Coptis chinensis]